MLSLTFLKVLILIVISLSANTQSAVMVLDVFMLTGYMQNVIILSVVAPIQAFDAKEK